MKRRSLLIIGALAFSSIIGLTSCNNESPIIDKVDDINEKTQAKSEELARKLEM